MVNGKRRRGKGVDDEAMGYLNEIDNPDEGYEEGVAPTEEQMTKYKKKYSEVSDEEKKLAIIDEEEVFFNTKPDGTLFINQIRLTDKEKKFLLGKPFKEIEKEYSKHHSVEYNQREYGITMSEEQIAKQKEDYRDRMPHLGRLILFALYVKYSLTQLNKSE